jgi:DNA-binding MarR family transcriptional regulator
MFTAKTAASALVSVAQALRRIDPNMPLSRAEVFFAVAAAEEPWSLTDLAAELKISLSKISRDIGELGKMGRVRQGDDGPERPDGAGLVEAVEDLMNRRKYVVRLTSKGNALMETIKKELERKHGKAAR